MLLFIPFNCWAFTTKRLRLAIQRLLYIPFKVWVLINKYKNYLLCIPFKVRIFTTTNTDSF